jgi:glycosyltransferase involved in cell wall biosynthesis
LIVENLIIRRKAAVNSYQKVSIVVPTYNQGQYLPACLDSIFFQDYPNLEIVVINDASTDDTHQIIEEYKNDVRNERVSFASYYNEAKNEIERTEHFRFSKKGRELVVLENEKNMGSTPTYNRGFMACTGEYCTYVASDDICHPNMISTMVEVLDRGEADFVYSDMFIIDDNGRILRQFNLPDYNFEACFANWYLCGVSKLYRRQLHEQFGYYNNDYLANDYECYLRFAMNGVKFKHIPKALYSVRAHIDRNIDVHSPSNWTKLLEESKSLVRKARLFLRSQD